MSKILFFSPNSAVWSWAYREALVADALQQGGNEIVYINCGGVFDKFCVSMMAHGLTQYSDIERKKKICVLCDENKFNLKSCFGLNGYDLNSGLTKEDYLLIDKTLENITKENFIHLTIDEVKIGCISIIELLNNYKKSNFDFNKEEWNECQIALRNALISFYSAKKIITKEKPDSIVAWSTEYSVNNAFCKAGLLSGIPFYWICSGNNIASYENTLSISKNYFSFYIKELKRHWADYKNTPCPGEVLTLITDHFIELFSGKHPAVYSSGKSDNYINIRSRFGIKNDQRIIVALMSSYDELFSGEISGTIPAATNLLFQNQVEWIQELLKYIRVRNDLFLIIRVHPREFPNKRDSVRSEHSVLLEKLLSDLPFNSIINWPTDNISLYDIVSEADVVLCAWSSAGKEMSLLGLPVVIYSSELINYPADLNYIGNTIGAYFKKIEQALADGWNFERIRYTYRWYALEHKYSVIDSSELAPAKYRKLNIFQRIYRKFIRTLFPDMTKKFAEKDREYLNIQRKQLPLIKLVNSLITNHKNTILDILTPSDIKKNTIKKETKLLKKEIERILEVLYPNKTLPPSSLVKNYLKILKGN